MDNDPDKQECDEGPKGYTETDMRPLFAQKIQITRSNVDQMLLR